MLGMMRWWARLSWALAGCAGLALLLALACHPGLAMGAAAGMSAPPAPDASIESARGAQLVRVQVGSHGLVLRTLSLSLAVADPGASGESRQTSGPSVPHYGPLHRRPPPSLS